MWTRIIVTHYKFRIVHQIRPYFIRKVFNDGCDVISDPYIQRESAQPLIDCLRCHSPILALETILTNVGSYSSFSQIEDVPCRQLTNQRLRRILRRLVKNFRSSPEIVSAAAWGACEPIRLRSTCKLNATMAIMSVFV